MLYVQFFQKAATDASQVIEATGDRSVIVYDGRRAAPYWLTDAEDECRKRGYVALQFFRGATFTRSNPCTRVFPVTQQA